MIILNGAFYAVVLFGILVYWFEFLKYFNAYVLNASTTSEALNGAFALSPLFSIGIFLTTVSILMLTDVFS